MNNSILIVEDQENDAFLLQCALQKAGVQNLAVVSDGQQALDYLSGTGLYADRRTFPLPALIFLDLKLPCVHGFEVLQWIREQSILDRVVVVVLTSSGLEADIGRAYCLGANTYVVKPSSFEKLIETAKDFANWWLKHDRYPFGAGHGEAMKLEVAEGGPDEGRFS